MTLATCHLLIGAKSRRVTNASGARCIERCWMQSIGRLRFPVVPNTRHKTASQCVDQCIAQVWSSTAPCMSLFASVPSFYTATLGFLPLPVVSPLQPVLNVSPRNPVRVHPRCLFFKMTSSLDRVVLIDMDNTLVNFDLEFGKRWVAARPEDSLERIQNREHFELEQNFPPSLQPLAIEIMSQPGFFISFEPQPYAVEAVREMTQAGLHVLLCTAPLPFQYETCVAEKYAWVRKHLGEEFLSRILITRDKTVVKGKVLIDDKPRVKGVCEKPEWIHVVFEQSYNRTVQDGPRLRDWKMWKEVLEPYIQM